MKEIQLTQGHVAIIDDEDYDRLSKYKWFSFRNNGYFYSASSIDKKITLMHRYIMNISDKNIHIDHKNHNTLDNRKENLRACSRSQNLANQGIKEGKRFKGVYTEKGRDTYRANISYHGKSFMIGRFDTEEEAAIAYNKKALELFGEFSVLNVV
jgi:hypothetical protein